ncbi:MAG TPA: hypothetical protein VIX84_17460 [Acidimicrobiales bacterium]
MRAAGRARRSRVLALAALMVGAVTGLAACDSQGSGQALARQACVHVQASVRDWQRSSVPGTSPATVAELQKEATQELRAALPLAAAANSDDGTWNSLMTVISESSTIDETHLVPSLRAQCAVADTNLDVNPQNPAG